MPKEKKLLRSKINVGTKTEPVYKWCSGYTRAELRANEEKKRREYQAEKPAPASKTPSFRQYAEEWMTLYKARIRQSTRRMYAAILENWIYPAIGTRAIDQVTRQDVQQIMNSMAGMSASTIRKAYLTLSQIFANAVEDELIDRTPLRRITKPEGATREIPPVDPARVESLAERCLRDPDGLLPLLLLYTGLRRGEALALQWQDVGDTEIRVSRTLSWFGNQASIGPAKTRASVRAVPLLPIVREKLPARGDPDEYVFGGKTPWTSTKFRRTWQRLCRNIPELCGIHPHQLRHTYTDLLRHAGVDILAAQHILGHSDYKVTANRYSTFDSLDRQAAENRLLQFTSRETPAPSAIPAK